MARPLKNDLAARDLQKATTRLNRTVRAKPKDIELWAYANLGMYVSAESIRKVFSGDADPTACALELLIVLREFYECEPSDLGQFAQDRLEPVLALFSGDDGPGGQRVARSRCSVLSLAPTG